MFYPVCTEVLWWWVGSPVAGNPQLTWAITGRCRSSPTFMKWVDLEIHLVQFNEHWPTFEDRSRNMTPK
jgi:hypothetical protein